MTIWHKTEELMTVNVNCMEAISTKSLSVAQIHTEAQWILPSCEDKVTVCDSWYLRHPGWGLGDLTSFQKVQPYKRRSTAEHNHLQISLLGI